MATGGSQERGKAAEEPRRLSARIAPYADIILKLTPALLTAVGAWFAATYQSQNAGISLLNQREQAETELRATMFANLIGPITGSPKDRALSPEDERLLVELLTLNFHEHVEFKPLLAHADARLAAKLRTQAKRSIAYGELNGMRHSLQSVVGRVRDRQVAVLQKECGRNSRLCPTASFAERFKCAPSPTASGPEPGARPLSGNPQCLTFSETENSLPPHVVIAPDGKYELRLWMGEVDWDKQFFRMSVNLRERKPGDSQAVPLEQGTPFDFTLTPYDLPFTDNTVVDKDHRFSLIVKDILPLGQNKKDIEIWVVWFPEGYVLPNERPVNYQEIRKVLKLD